MFKSFKKFIEEKHPYISALSDELGINTKDLEKEPQIGSFFSIGSGNINNIGAYKVIEFKRNEDGEITHAVVCQNNDLKIKNRQYQDKDGKITRIDKDDESKKFIVPIEELDGLLSQDFMPPPSSGGGAAMI